MALSPELADLKARCVKALQIGASLARIDEHLAKVGAGAPPFGVSKERHLLAHLDALDAGDVPEAAEPEPAPEPEDEPEPKDEPEEDAEAEDEDEDAEGDALEEEDAEATPEKVAAAPKKKSGKKNGKRK